MTAHATVKKHSIPNLEVHSVLLLAALVLGAASAAQAQTSSTPLPAYPNGPSPQMTTSGVADAIPHNRTTATDLEAAFGRADANRDGKLSRQEAEHFPALVHRFDQIDTNHDNFISRDEFYKAAGSGP